MTLGNRTSREGSDSTNRTFPTDQFCFLSLFSQTGWCPRPRLRPRAPTRRCRHMSAVPPIPTRGRAFSGSPRANSNHAIVATKRGARGLERNGKREKSRRREALQKRERNEEIEERERERDGSSRVYTSSHVCSTGKQRREQGHSFTIYSFKTVRMSAFTASKSGSYNPLLGASEDSLNTARQFR